MISPFRYLQILLGFIAIFILSQVAAEELESDGLTPGTQLAWETVIGATYQLQAASNPSGPWENLGEPATGDGNVSSRFSPEEGAPLSYRLEITLPATASGENLLQNGSFESGDGGDPTSWTATGSQQPTRIDTDSFAGSHSLRARIQNVGTVPREGLIRQSLSTTTIPINPGEAYQLEFQAKQITEGSPSYLQTYELQWRDASGGTISSSGTQSFEGGESAWAEISSGDLTAPEGAVGISLRFRFVTGAILNAQGEVLIDDISLTSGEPTNIPGETVYESLEGSRLASITWETDTGAIYQPVISTNLSDWQPHGPVLSGAPDGISIFIPFDERTYFARLGRIDPADLGPIVPLFDVSTPLEAAVSIDTGDALVTRLGDRARDRHARESEFNAYDHYLSWYWEERTLGLEITDYVAKGGDEIIFDYQTQAKLGAAEFRAFYRGINTPAEYYDNRMANYLGDNRYTVTIEYKQPENTRLAVGDLIEVEISQFLEAAQNGRNNYYGTTFLYVVGQGVVPWQGIGERLDSIPIPEHAWTGGYTTLPYQYSDEPDNVFKQTAGNISPDNIQPFMLGRRLHHTDFADGSHSEPGNPIFAEHVGKLGPQFVANSCVACHTNNGRSLPPATGAPLLKGIAKLGSDASGTPHPELGAVFQPLGNSEGTLSISSYTTTTGEYGDGTPFTLRKPNYAFSGTTPSFYSVRSAQPLVGLGLLEAIDETTIITLADPDDSDNDGISGRARSVIDPETGETRLGRFTAKGGRARLGHQVAAALNTDMGISTSVFPRLDDGSQPASPELSDSDVALITRYVALLGIAAQRDIDDPEILRGKQLFTTANCAACHIPELPTSPHYPMAELRDQIIRPFTDLLLHDMGPGLADNMAEGDASGSEWRTAPLWSIGLTDGVNGAEAYLHDGRARTLEEAILWHGGEAEASKESFRTLPAADRAALVAYLRSL